MASSYDGASSGNPVADYMYMNYAPETCEDLSFCGAAVGAPPCRGHDLEPRKCVAFEGANTGRRFYECCVQDYADNCGFVQWVDVQDWPETLQNALRRLWSMYHEASDKRIEERLDNAKLIEVLVEEKERFKRNYYSLMADVEKLLKDQEKNRVAENHVNVNDESDGIFDLDRRGLEAEVVKLNSELFELKEEKKQWQAKEKHWEAKEKHWEAKEKLTQEEWQGKEDAWKVEKKKLEVAIYDLFKVNSVNKEKLLKIKEAIGQI